MRRTKQYPNFARWPGFIWAAEGFVNDQIAARLAAAKSSIIGANGFLAEKLRRPGSTLSSGPFPDFFLLIWRFPDLVVQIRLVLANCESVSPSCGLHTTPLRTLYAPIELSAN
jgi:hypothetical protein